MNIAEIRIIHRMRCDNILTSDSCIVAPFHGAKGNLTAVLSVVTVVLRGEEIKSVLTKKNSGGTNHDISATHDFRDYSIS